MTRFIDIFRPPRTWYEIVIASCMFWAGVILTLALFGIYPDNHSHNDNQDDDGIGTLQEWDYTVYGQYISVSCMNYCHDYDDENCDLNCVVSVKKLYAASYCNLECDDNITYRLNITPQQDMLIDAQEIKIAEGDCNVTKCYGIFMGWNN